jgi:hypothetical protein
MPENVTPAVYIAAHLAAAICTNSLQTNDFKPDALKNIAQNAANVYRAVFVAVIEELKSKSA